MRKTMAVGLVVLAAAACDRQGGGPEARASAPASTAASPAGDTAGLRATARTNHKIEVKLKKQNGVCVAEDPRTETVVPGDAVRWKYKNNCGAKKTQKIDRLTAPISGDCDKGTDVEDGEEKEGRDCIVDAGAAPGTYKYKIDGSVVLDPELEIPPPPPPPSPPTVQ